MATYPTRLNQGWPLLLVIVAALLVSRTVFAAAALYERIQLVHQLDDIAQVLGVVGKPTSQRQESVLGVTCVLLNYQERSIQTLSVAEATVRLCAGHVVAISYQTRPLINF